MILRGVAETELWADFVRDGVDVIERVRTAEVAILRHGPEWSGPTDPELADAARRIAAHVREGKGLGFVALALRPAWRSVLECGRVARGRPVSAEEFSSIADAIEISRLRAELRDRWLRLVADSDPESRAEMAAPEVVIDQRIRRVQALLEWPESRIEEVVGLARDAGFSAAGLDTASGDGAADEWARLKRQVEERLQPAVSEFLAHCRREGYRKRRSQLRAALQNEPPGAIGAALLKAVESENADAYQQGLKIAARLNDLKAPHSRRAALLDALQKVAPSWAAQIAQRVEPHNGSSPPGNPRAAWKWKQLDAALEARAAVDLQVLQDRLASHEDALRKTTAELVEKLAWAGQIRRTTGQARQDLMGYQKLLARIGKGTGKRAPRLRREAREKLKSCKAAVPVWIMPLARAVESFDPVETRFDVVIVDEASQMDVMGLLAFHLAERVLVVGDDEQVSPSAVGQKLDEVDQLIDEHLDGIPNRRLYDGRTSIYDLAHMTFNRSRMLKEHFRCVPEIIAYSNRLSYHGLIRPLRDGSSARVKPSTVRYRVRHAREDAANVNAVEAQHTTALIVAALEQPEYAEATVGVISMLGSRHDLQVDDLLRHRLPAEQYVKHRVLCGIPPHFQGDERDVVFLNLVKGPPSDGLLRKQGLDNKLWKQRYNVAASRARDQLWVVHSMDAQNDLLNRPGFAGGSIS